MEATIALWLGPAVEGYRHAVLVLGRHFPGDEFGSFILGERPLFVPQIESVRVLESFSVNIWTHLVGEALRIISVIGELQRQLQKVFIPAREQKLLTTIAGSCPPSFAQRSAPAR